MRSAASISWLRCVCGTMVVGCQSDGRAPRLEPWSRRRWTNTTTRPPRGRAADPRAATSCKRHWRVALARLGEVDATAGQLTNVWSERGHPAADDVGGPESGAADGSYEIAAYADTPNNWGWL
jgi:hypothetical protein